MGSPFHYLESDQDPLAIAAQHDLKTATTDVNSSTDRQEEPLFTANIIALGKTGDGKSSLLNDMLGYDAFHRKRSVKVCVDARCYYSIGTKKMILVANCANRASVRVLETT